ncbi:MAG: peptide chain release factor-like protein [Candidatus Omnitrophota bacterium]
MNVSSAKKKALEEKMRGWGVKESDLTERFIKSSGCGGQHVNKVSTCVYLKHNPTGIEVKCSSERSQAVNRFLARGRLVEKIENAVTGEVSAKRKQIEKIRRQKRKRSKRAKEKMLENKRQRAKKKKLRGPVGYE